MRNFNAITGKPMHKFNLYDQKIDFAAIKEACREKMNLFCNRDMSANISELLNRAISNM